MAQVKHAYLPLTSPLSLHVCKFAYMKTLAERIKRRMKVTGVEPPKIADDANVERQAVYAWISGETKSLKAETVFGAARALKANPEWLATGNGPEELPPGERANDLSDQAIEVARAWQRLPDFKQAGYAQGIMVDAIVAEQYPHIVRSMRIAATATNPNYYKLLDVFVDADAQFRQQLSLDWKGKK